MGNELRFRFALDLEFAIHGGHDQAATEGIAAPWAASAETGAPAGVGGPRGSLVLTGRPDAWFLAGDETAVPLVGDRHRPRGAEQGLVRLLDPVGTR